MASTIPRSVALGLNKVTTLSEESLQEVIAALESVPVQIRQHRIFDDSEFNLKSVSADEAHAIRDAILPLYGGLVVGKLDINAYVEDLMESFKEEEFDWLQSEENASILKERLIRLLGIKSLQLIAKAHDVLLEHAHTFSTARIVSDIRPIFGGKAEDQPEAAVIVHMLNISYYLTNQRREFVVALDTKDIPYLIEILERAKAKAESLKAVISSTNMTYLDIV